MRIIAGEFKGRALKAPKGTATRPTTDRVRESVFSALSSIRGGLEGAVVLDAFAGSGALSFESLSRGAHCAWLYERDRAALQAINENMRLLKLAPSQARLQRRDVLKTPPLSVALPFDVVFLDPPYAYAAEEVFGLIDRLCEAGSLDPSALLVYEHAVACDDEVDAAAQKRSHSLVSRKKYGDTVVDFFSVREGDAE